jgi:hypothetical protein
MAATWSLGAQGRHARLVYDGTAHDPAESLAILRGMAADGLVRQDLPLLVDLRQADMSTAPSLGQLRTRIDAALETFPLPCRIAIVTTPGLAFGVSRMVEALLETGGGVVNVFTDEPAAVSWLDEAVADVDAERQRE